MSKAPSDNSGRGNKGGRGVGTAASATKGGKGGKGHTRWFGGMGGYKGVKYSDAAKIVNGQVRHEVRGMKNQKDQIRDLFQSTKGDLSHIFGESGDYIKSLMGTIAGTFTDQAVKSNSIYDALNSQMQSGASGIQDAALAELSRMGLAPQAAGDMSSDANFLQAMVQQQRANAGSVMSSQAAGAGAVGNLLAGMNKGAAASALGQALNTRNSALKDVNAQIRDLRLGRSDAINQLLMQMNDSRFQQWLGLQNLNMQRASMHHGWASQGASSAQDAAYAQTLANLYQSAYKGGNKGSKGGKGGKGTASGSSSNPDQYNGPLWYDHW